MPGGVAHCWCAMMTMIVWLTIVFLVCVSECFWFFLPRRDGDFLPRRKSVFVCLFSLCIFYYECSIFQIVSTMFLTIPIAIRETERRVCFVFVTVL